METLSTIAALRSVVGDERRVCRSVGLVPTMGAFHDGHLSLMRRAKDENDVAVVTLFVNPTQFNDPEDFKKYPRDASRDNALAKDAGVDIIFTPDPAEMYRPGYDTTVTAGAIAERLEGRSRPGHFAGVATVVAKLLNIVQADRAYFGEKDWQQLQVIKRITADLDIPTEIRSHPTVREADGLAMSSRNVRLSTEERRAATVVSSALLSVKTMADAGTTDATGLAAALNQAIAREPLARIDYAVVVDPSTMADIITIDGGAIAAVAVYFGSVRLIDNMRLR